MAIPKSQEHEFTSRFGEYVRTLDCVHCGLCLPDCPTYGISGREADSPRGRIYLMRGYAERTILPSRESLRHLDQCIVCRACETVCPSGIRMGAMMESFRHDIGRAMPRRGWRHYVAKLLLRELIPHRHRIRALTDLLYLYERLGLRRLARALGRIGGRIAELDALLPPMLPPAERRLSTSATLPGGLHRAHGKARLRAALFLGCIASEWFTPTHRATIRLLTRAGCDVLVPDAQTCCGALHRHGGFLRQAEELYRANRDVFAASGADVIVVNAAGCGAALKEPPPGMLEDLGVPVRDVCELLDSIGLPEAERPVPCRVVYDQPCHLVHGQKIGPDAVLGLLRRVPGVEILPFPTSDRCCGSGGVYNLVHPEMAAPILAEKVQAIRESGADVVVTGNPGCWLQVRSGLRDDPIEVLHPVDLLDRAYAENGDSASASAGADGAAAIGSAADDPAGEVGNA